MSTKVTILDDVTGEELPDHSPEETLAIQMGELAWHVHLSEASADKVQTTITKLLRGMEPVTELERPYIRQQALRAPKRTRAAIANTPDPEERAEQRNRIREYVESSSLPTIAEYRQKGGLGDRGRIPAVVLEGYYADHPDEPRLFGES